MWWPSLKTIKSKTSCNCQLIPPLHNMVAITTENTKEAVKQTKNHLHFTLSCHRQLIHNKAAVTEEYTKGSRATIPTSFLYYTIR